MLTQTASAVLFHSRVQLSAPTTYNTYKSFSLFWGAATSTDIKQTWPVTYLLKTYYLISAWLIASGWRLCIVTLQSMALFSVTVIITNGFYHVVLLLNKSYTSNLKTLFLSRFPKWQWTVFAFDILFHESTLALDSRGCSIRWSSRRTWNHCRDVAIL